MKITLLILLNIILIALVSYVGIKSNLFTCSKPIVGENWEAKRFGNKYVVSIKNKSEVVEALTNFVVSQKITAGEITGLGAVSEATLRFFDPKTKKYVDKTIKGQMEVTNLTGNISTKDGKEYLHLHITLGDKQYKALAGHLLSAKLSGAGEFIVEAFPCGHLERSFNEEVGLNFYDFNK